MINKNNQGLLIYLQKYTVEQFVSCLLLNISENYVAKFEV